MTPPHGATGEGCDKFHRKRAGFVHPDKFHPLQELQVSAVGLGTYLGHFDDATDALYEKAVALSLSHGCNLIDTAVNYRCQRSERAVGRALAKLLSDKKISRGEVVVATKGGFIPFDAIPTPNAQAYFKSQWVDTGIVSADDIVSGCHCMHPAFIQKQIEKSLDNLKLETIDIYYLHNPETQLPVIGQDLFYARLEKAFQVLEDHVARGKIQYYGLATWTAFREAPGMSESISLERSLRLAEKVGGASHHFKAIQLPYNLAMLEAVSIHSQKYGDKSYPIIAAAHMHGFSVMVSSSLLQAQVLGMSPGLALKLPGRFTMAQKALQFVASTPGVTSGLVGMKQEKHVEENLAVLKEADWDLKTLQKIGDALT